MDEKYIQMIIETQQSSKSAHHRLDKLEEDVGEIKELTMETKANREDLNKMNERLENIEKKPANNWDKIVTTSIGTIVGAIVGAIIGLILK